MAPFIRTLPDGMSIAFESDRDGDSEIFVMELASRRMVQLTENDAFDGMPYWKSDSVVFQSDRDGDSASNAFSFVSSAPYFGC